MLTKANFLSRSNYTEDEINDAYLTFIIDSLNDIVEEDLGTLFTLVNDQNIKIPGTNLDYIKIGAWQSSNLVVKIGYFGAENPTLTTLVENRDYRVKKYRKLVRSDQPNPVVAIKLIGYQYTGWNPFGHENYSQKLSPEAFLDITGTYGWSEGMPADVELALYNVLYKYINQYGLKASTQGKGVVTSESDLTSSISLDTLDYEKLDAILGSIRNDPGFQSVMYKYRQYTQNSIIS